jgi:hypothetical protein
MMRPGAIVAGLLLVGLGVAMFVDTTDMFRVNAGRLVTPFVLIALGSIIVLDKGGFAAQCGRRGEEDGQPRRIRRRGGSFGGLWLIGVGCWMLVSQTHLFGLSYDTSWPLFIVLAGVMILVRAWR